MRIGQHAPISQVDGFMSQVAALQARIAELERVAGRAFGDLAVGGDLTVSGTLTVNGQQVPTPAQANYTTIVAATNFSAILNLFRYGPLASIRVSMTRTGGNVGPGSAVIATIGAAGRGTFATYTPSIPVRSATATAMYPSLVWVDPVSGQVSVEWPATWNTSQNLTATGTVPWEAP